MDNEYYVVEFRLPILISSADSPKDAAEKAKKELRDELGVDLSSWYARVFEYQTGETGDMIEYFSNPNGSEFKRIDQNVKEHEDLTHGRQSNSRPES
jgi:hypothetical protein